MRGNLKNDATNFRITKTISGVRNNLGRKLKVEARLYK